MPDTRTASCNCGAIRIEARGQPVRVGLCHCTTCWKEGGAPFTASAIWRAEDVTISPMADTASLTTVGRPSVLSEQPTRVFKTFVMIDSWRKLAQWLAQQDGVPDSELETMLKQAKVPWELWDQMRAVPGRHRRYRDVPGLTAAQQRRLAALAAHLDNKPPEEWTKDDRRLDEERAELRARRHGKERLRRINLSLRRGSSAAGVATLLPRVETPSSLRCGLWRAFDAWGARQYGVGVKTFRDWRRKLEQQQDDPLFATLRHKPTPSFRMNFGHQCLSANGSVSAP
jgi:hypothetical protein